MKKFLILLVIAALFACSKEEAPQSPQAPVEQDTGKAVTAPEPAAQKAVEPEATAPVLKVVPEKASKTTVLKARAEGFTIDQAELIWLVNESPVSTPRIEFFDTPDMEVIKGDTVQAVATVDGLEVASNVVTITNSEPELKKVTLTPAVFAPGQNVGLEVVAEDPDGDDVTLEYEWTVNESPAGVEKELDAELQRGDSFTATVTPYDGEEYGKSITLYRKVGNLPPRITQHSNFEFDGTTYVYQVDAADPDGDPMTFYLKSGPKGMIINSTTGQVNWEVPEDFSGTAKYNISVSDGQGGEAMMEMSFSVGNEEPEK